MRKKLKKNRLYLLILSIMIFSMIPVPVYATEVVTSKINALNEIVLSIVTAAGVIVLAWGIFEFATAYQSHDTSQQTMSLKKVISGILMVGAPTIINLLK